MLEANFKKKLWSFDLEGRFTAGSEIVVLWGPSGAGKTTVLHCLAGLSSPESGFIKLNGRVMYSSGERTDIPTRSRNIGYLFQDYALFPHMTVRQNVQYGVRCRKNKKEGFSFDPEELLDSFGVGHLSGRYPSQLSGGEKQRVALARALAVRPQLLLLDEPFSALDKNTRIVLRKEIKRLHREWQIPFVLVTHEEEDAVCLGDRVITLENGRARDKSLLLKHTGS